MEEMQFDWDDSISNHECFDGKQRIELTILDIDIEKREVTILAKRNDTTKRETIRLYTDEIGFLYICYPYSYSEEIYIQESYL